VKPRVLIVDDSLTVRMDLSEAFETAGFAPVPRPNLEDTRAALAGEVFALIVLDVVLPDGDGIEFLAELKKSPGTATVPVMLLSTEAQVRDRIRGLKTGADEYVGKPYDSGYVIARARELLRSRAVATGDTRALVLVIDDSATFREAIAAALEGTGYKALTAASGEEGLHMAVAYRPAAVLVDSRLPGIDGATVVRRMREDVSLRRLPTLLLTATEDAAEELRALEAGADGFARKDRDFTVVLARLAALLRAASTPSAFEQQASLLGPKKILAVDDSPTYLEELAAQLRLEGYDVVLAQSGEEALELLAVQPVDCVLLDVMMPGLSGLQVCVRIKGSPSLQDIPLLMLTSLDEQKALIDGINAGADDYIPKSNDFEVIRARVRAALRRQQIEDENRGVRERLLRKELETAEARAQKELAETRAALLAELQESEERVRIAAEAADLGVWNWDIKTGKLAWTDRCQALFGVPQDAAVSYESFIHCLHPEDRARTDEALRQALAQHEDIEVECRAVWQDGSTHWIVARGRGLYDNSGQPLRVTGVAMDVTQRKHTQEALLRSEKLASVGRMAATMAHEINNPLEAIINALYLITSDPTLSASTRSNVALAERELSRVSHITKQTLGFYRENGRPDIVCLSKLADELIGLYSRKLNYKAIQVEKRWRTQGEISGIAGELRQIISNLMGNAIDALAPHGTLHLRITPFHVKDYAVRLTVADSGTGIKRENLPSIFEPFFTTKQHVGTGLGLWIAREIVNKHSGSIRVRSKPGKGTVFAVYLPMTAVDGDANGSGERAASASDL
jgi:PAS domain S-box-containing protein